MVRECIKQIVTEVKKIHPTNFVKVNVDTNRHVFRIARKPPKEDPDPEWKYDFRDVPIPDIAMDLSIRQVPKGFKLVTKSQEPPVPVPDNNAVPALEENMGNRRMSRDSTDELSVDVMHE
jgi:hypothetical protein